VAVASSGPYADLQLAPDSYHASTPPFSFYRPAALPATQPQRQSTQGKAKDPQKYKKNCAKVCYILECKHPFAIFTKYAAFAELIFKVGYYWYVEFCDIC